MEKLLFFVGRWGGLGKVIEKPVEFLEEATFVIHRQEPIVVINYWHQTWLGSEKKAPLHLENGIIKIFPPKEGEDGRKVEANFSHPFSLNEFEYGVLTDNKLVMEASKPEHFQRGESAKGK